MIEADRADYSRAKLDHDLIVAITTLASAAVPHSPAFFQVLELPHTPTPAIKSLSHSRGSSAI